MANFHSRSSSFPSQSHPVTNVVENRLDRLKASQATMSASSSSICANLASLRDLHDAINNLIRMSSTSQAFSHEQGGNYWINELLEGSLRLVDLCGFSRDIVQLTKESIQELESSVRRQADDVDAYVASRKRINKMINKCLKKNVNHSTKQNPTSVLDISKMLKEAESLDLSTLSSVLILLTGEKERSNKRSWSLLSKFSQSSRVYSNVEKEGCAGDLCSLNVHLSKKSVENINLKQLKATEMSIQEIEEGLEALSRSLVQTRVSLLNALSL